MIVDIAAEHKAAWLACVAVYVPAEKERTETTNAAWDAYRECCQHPESLDAIDAAWRQLP